MVGKEKIGLRDAFELLRSSYERYATTHPDTSIHDFLDPHVLRRMGVFQYDRKRANTITEDTMQWLDESGFTIQSADFSSDLEAILAYQQRRNFVSMNASVHIGKEELVALTGKLYALLFLIDDWLSNDTVKFLSETEKTILDLLKNQLFQALLFGQTELPPLTLETEGGITASDFAQKTHLLFSTCVTVFLEIKQATDDEYAAELLGKLGKHLSQGTTDHDAMILEHPDVERYRQLREDVSGMHVAIELIKMVSESYRQVRILKKESRIAKHLTQLERLLARFGGEGNDLLSIDKELRDETIFNLLAVAFLSRLNERTEESGSVDDLDNLAYLAFTLSLHDVQDILRELLNEFADELDTTTLAVNEMTTDDLTAKASSARSGEDQLNDVKQAIHRYIDGLRQYFLATKEWQMGDGVGRYAAILHLLRELRPALREDQASAAD